MRATPKSKRLRVATDILLCYNELHKTDLHSAVYNRMKDRMNGDVFP